MPDEEKQEKKTPHVNTKHFCNIDDSIKCILNSLFQVVQLWE